MSVRHSSYFGAEDTAVTYATAQTNAVVLTPVTGRSISIQGYCITADTAMLVTVKIGTTVCLRFYFPANGGANCASEAPISVGAANETINVTTSTNGNVTFSFWGYQD